MSEWQPIETAPKDGTWFLGFESRRHGVNVRPYRWSKTQMSKHGNGWHFEGNGLHNPTHWRPLPEPPK